MDRQIEVSNIRENLYSLLYGANLLLSMLISAIENVLLATSSPVTLASGLLFLFWFYLNKELAMATYVSTRTMTQRVCITLGYIFVAVGLVGIVVPGFMGMHLSMSHNFIHLISGVLALWSGYADESRKAYNFCIGFGALYGVLGIAGFIFGEPGYPGVGHMEADENLLRVIPNVLEFGGADHIVHIVFSGIFLITAFAFRQSRAEAGVRKDSYRSVTNFTVRDSVRDKEMEDRARTPLDEGIRHIPNQDRHSDYEKRV